MHPCERCDQEFGAPATLRIHQNKCEVATSEKDVRVEFAPKKAEKKEVTKKK